MNRLCEICEQRPALEPIYYCIDCYDPEIHTAEYRILAYEKLWDELGKYIPMDKRQDIGDLMYEYAQALKADWKDHHADE